MAVSKYQRIPHSRPTLGREETEKIAEVIRSAYIAQGEKVEQFEKAFTKKLGGGYAAGLSSGTAALHLTLLAMGIGAGDEVVIPSFVCAALLNAVNYVGATPVLAEMDPLTYNLDPEDVQRRLTKNTKAVIVPHLFGLAANMDSLLALNVPIIEDCAQAVGTKYRDKPVGTFGVAATYSFFATKVITTGEGGMVVSRSKQLIDRIKDIREYDKKNTYQIRYNYKMTNIQAAMGMSQLNRLDRMIERRRFIAEKYDRSFRHLCLRLPFKDPGHIYYRYIIQLKTHSKPWIQMLHENGIECDRPVHRPLHLYLGLNGFLRTETVWKQTVSLPIYPTLSNPDADRVIKKFTAICEEMTREA